MFRESLYFDVAISISCFCFGSIFLIYQIKQYARSYVKLNNGRMLYFKNIKLAIIIALSVSHVAHTNKHNYK